MSNFNLDLQPMNYTGISKKLFIHDIMCQLELYNLPVVIATDFNGTLGESKDNLEYDNCYEVGKAIRRIQESSAPLFKVGDNDIIDVEYTRLYTLENRRTLLLTHNGLILLFSPDRGFELTREDNKLILKRMDNGLYTIFKIEN